MTNPKKIILVFKTSVQDEEVAQVIVEKLSQNSKIIRVNFDLEDVDNILRVESSFDLSQTISLELNKLGFVCEALK